MKFILLLFYILIFFSINCQAVTLKRNDLKTITIESKTKTDRNDNSKQHDTLSTIKSFNKNYNSEYLDNFIKQQSLYNSNFSNQISTLNTSLTFWGIIISVIITVFTIYFSYILNKTIKLLKKSKKINKEILELQNSIDNNFDSIYEKILDRELDKAFERIILCPDDIVHLYHVMAIRDLPDQYYGKLRKIIMKWDKNELDEPLIRILRLVLQHFPDRTILDSILFDILIKKWDHVHYGLYVKEFRIFIKHYCYRIKDNIHSEKESIIRIFDGVRNATYTKNKKEYLIEIYNAIAKYLSKEDQFEILLFLDKENKCKNYSPILANYSNNFNTQFTNNDNDFFQKYNDLI